MAQQPRPPRPRGIRPSPYTAYRNMLDRCYNPCHPKYYRYGGRGIMVCTRWRSSFETFMKDMGEHRPGMILGRIDPDGDYGPKNCRWVPDDWSASTPKPVNPTPNGKPTTTKTTIPILIPGSRIDVAVAGLVKDIMNVLEPFQSRFAVRLSEHCTDVSTSYKPVITKPIPKEGRSWS